MLDSLDGLADRDVYNLVTLEYIQDKYVVSTKQQPPSQQMSFSFQDHSKTRSNADHRVERCSMP
jgi:hypothetical protein